MSSFSEAALYQFTSIHHRIILTYAVLVALTPLIPIPILDDWVKNMFLRSMVRQLTTVRGQSLNSDQIDALIQENFWDSCLDGCINLVLYLLREVLSKIFFFVEWRRAFNLVGVIYYTGFLIDAALQDGYCIASPDGSVEAAARLREAVRRTRYAVNLRLIQRLVRENIRPLAFIRAAWFLTLRAVSSLPRLLYRIPGAIWNGVQAAPDQVTRGAVSFWARLRDIPHRMRENFTQLVQVLLGKEKPREVAVIERIVQSLQTALMKIDASHFDQLHEQLVNELNPSIPTPPL